MSQTHQLYGYSLNLKKSFLVFLTIFYPDFLNLHISNSIGFLHFEHSTKYRPFSICTMCTVREVLSFDVQDKMNMLGFIANCYTRWVKCNTDIFDIQVNFLTDFIKDVCVSEGDETNKECESVNMYYAYNYICEIKDQDVKGLLDPIFITDVHKRLFVNTENKLKAGFYSNSRRIAQPRSQALSS